MVEYSIAGLVLKLELVPGVFHPTTTTQLLTEQMVDLEGKTLLDLGCGLGPIAIAAVLKGARRVYAVDIMPEACQATLRNAERNGVADRIEVLQGDLFEPVKGRRFDVIVADVSGMAEEVARISSWYPQPIPTGGPDGTGPTIRMLRDSPSYLNEGGYLLFPVLSLARSERILATAQEVYGDKVQQVASRMIPFNEDLRRNIELLNRLRREGIIHFVQKRSRYLWKLAIYKVSI